MKQSPNSIKSFEKILNKFTYDQIIEMQRIKLDNEESSKIHDKPVMLVDYPGVACLGSAWDEPVEFTGGCVVVE